VRPFFFGQASSRKWQSMKIKIIIFALAALFVLAIAVQLPAQQTIYIAPANTQQQALDQFGQSCRNLAEGIRRNREMKAQQEQYDREMMLRELQAHRELREQQIRNIAVQKEFEQQQAEINRKRVKKEAYEKAQIYFESESLDAQPKLVLLRQELAALDANKITRKEIP
jgi:glutamate synthase domain-containing protein 1